MLIFNKKSIQSNLADPHLSYMYNMVLLCTEDTNLLKIPTFPQPFSLECQKHSTPFDIQVK